MEGNSQAEGSSQAESNHVTSNKDKTNGKRHVLTHKCEEWGRFLCCCTECLKWLLECLECLRSAVTISVHSTSSSCCLASYLVNNLRRVKRKHSFDQSVQPTLVKKESHSNYINKQLASACNAHLALMLAI